MAEDLIFITVEFQIYKPNASVISLVGNFNQWNPEHDYLHRDRNGIFKLRKKLRPGIFIQLHSRWRKNSRHIIIQKLDIE